MVRKRRAPDYTGALAEPIYLEDHYKLTGGLGQLIQEPDVAAIRTQAAEKMRLLFEHYEIDPNDEQRWQELAIRLALARVRGLQLDRPKPGRKPTWKTGLGDELVRAVEDEQSRTGVEDALVKLREDKLGIWKGYSVPNLLARYREARGPGRKLWLL